MKRRTFLLSSIITTLTGWRPVGESRSSGEQALTPTSHVIRGMDHVGITVPNLDAASRFFEEAFDAEPLYDNIKRSDPPVEGPKAEEMLGLAPGMALITMRMMQLRNGPGLELFEMRGPDQHPPARPSDFGYQHIALYVDDIDYAIKRFVAAGGTMISDPNEMTGLEKGKNDVWCYGRTPWGSVIELTTYPSPEEYERETPLRRWKPPA
jgi:catechol 2,3-dioxygenase-like lactoylglutathione lyase family enzyme